jgi:hypothetical protein
MAKLKSVLGIPIALIMFALSGIVAGGLTNLILGSVVPWIVAMAISLTATTVLYEGIKNASIGKFHFDLNNVIRLAIASVVSSVVTMVIVAVAAVLGGLAGSGGGALGTIGGAIIGLLAGALVAYIVGVYVSWMLYEKLKKKLKVV